MRKTDLKNGDRCRFCDFVISLFVLSLLSMDFLMTSYAQVTQTPGTGSLNTQVNKVGNVYEITQGTRASSNLFHSFDTFSLGAVETARFQTINLVPDATVGNVLGRVTGGSPSNILGTINSATYYPNANLFLMNPAGIIFGPNASLNVGGSATFTTANYIKLADEKLFTAAPNPQDTLLSAASVAAFGFLDANPQGNITVGGSTLSAQPGQTLSFIGKDFTMTGGRLSAPGGQVRIASVASAGEILHQDLGAAPNINGDRFTGIGTINLSQVALVDVSANAAGTVKIRGGQLVMDMATISADTINVNGAAVAIDINVTGDISISSDGAPTLTARSSGSGDAGEIRIASANLMMTSTAQDSTLALIDTHTSGMGQAGKVDITTGDLEASGGSWFIDSGTAGLGNGSDVTIAATNIHLNDVNISTGGFRAINQGIFDATGFAGNIRLTADGTLDMTASVLSTDSFLGRGGDITLRAGNLQMLNGLIGSLSLGGSGAITITADSIRMTRAQIEAETAFEPGRDITLTGNVIELRDGTSIRNQTSGNAVAGNILVAATERLILSDQPTTSRPTGFYTNSLGVEGEPLDTLGGHAGSILIETPRLEMSGGARINTSTETSGRGGNVVITATDLISISGERRLPIAEDELSLGVTNPGGVFTRTVGSQFCSGPCGDAGHISITTGSLMLDSGASLDSGTTSTGQGGAIGITTTNSISLSGRLTDGTPSGISSRTTGTAPGSGFGGNIALTAGQSVTISNGASVSASSTGLGNAGNIAINAGQRLEMRDSSIKTEAARASGGNIDIQAIDRVRLVNSSISTSVLGGAGSGGNITIDPNVVVLQNSQVIAQAVQGAGGNISITTPLFLADSSSLVSASSQFGLNGTVTIQNPTSNLSGSLGTLAAKPRQAQSLLTQRCAALANGQASSFVVAGREQLPADPGGWLTSPLALAGLDADPFREGTVAEGTSNLAPRTSGLLANGTVSLRRFTPAGFLMANYADSEATGCHS